MADAKLIDGISFAAALRARIGRQVATLTARHGIIPGLAVVLVGDDPASKIYVRAKEKQTAEAGMASVGRRLAAQTSQDEVLGVVGALNADPAVHGILVQLPLPDQIDTRAIIEAVEPAKDLDGFHPLNVGRLANGHDALVPCTPLGCTMLLKDALGDLTGLNAVIVGRSTIVGKPMAQLLLAENCTVTMAHSRTRDLPAICRRADILVAAVGRPRMMKGDWIKPGAAVIDVGINRFEAEGGKTRLVGDVAFDEASLKTMGISSRTTAPGSRPMKSLPCSLSTGP